MGTRVVPEKAKKNGSPTSDGEGLHMLDGNDELNIGGTGKRGSFCALWAFGFCGIYCALSLLAGVNDRFCKFKPI